MRSAKDFFRPLAVGAPEPLREIPARPSRAIHFFDPSNAKMAAKVPQMVGLEAGGRTSCSATSRTRSRPTTRRPHATVSSRSRRSTDFGSTQLWTRVNSLDSPWALDDLTTLVTEIGDKLDVIMVPKVQGAEDIAYVDRLLAQLEARAGLAEAAARARDPRDRPRRGQRRGDLRRQPADAGPQPRPGRPGRRPPDEDDPRRRRPSRLPRPPGPGEDLRRRRRRGRARDVPAGPVALHDRADGRRLRSARDLPLLRALRGHRRHGRLRGPVPQRLPARLRRRVEPAPDADRRSPTASSPRASTTSPTPDASSRPCKRTGATAPAR